MNKQTVTVELTKEELQALSASLGNHSRLDLRNHIEEDFGEDASERIIPEDDILLSIILGENTINNLFGKLREALEEATV
ncbi:MAG: hypothetical protein LC650_04890 [Actinobacteria bacterium]|nr:hypothetical protein [Actinomycetota bacterium]